VALTNVVGRGDPFQFTTVSLVKVVPVAGVTSRVKPVGLQYGVDAAGGELPSTETAPMLSPEMVKLPAATLPPPGAGVSTDTGTILANFRSVAKIGTLSRVGLRYLVALEPFKPFHRKAFHWMKEHGTKLAPVTVRVNGPEPTIALEGAMGAVVLTVGTGNGDGGAATEKLAELETAEPLDTVIVAVPCATVSVYGMRAVNCVALTSVVGRDVPFQLTIEPPTKFVPSTCKVNPVGLQLGVEVAGGVEPATETELMVGVGG
jgi:hypothetical protein